MRGPTLGARILVLEERSRYLEKLIYVVITAVVGQIGVSFI